MMKKLYATLICTVIAFGALAQDSLNISVMFHWNDSTIPGSTFYDNAYNEIWGYTQNGREYAIIGSTLGTHIWDLTDMQNPVEVEFIAGEVQGPAIVHRDYHDYAGYLYIVSDEGVSTLQIADLSFLPDSAPVVYDSNALMQRAHNIFIDTASAIMYRCGGNSCQMKMYDISNPTNPVFLLDCATLPFWGQIGYVHDVFVRGDTAWCNAGGNGLFVVDFTNIASPQLIASETNYPHQGYNHSGWLNEDGTLYALADETHGMKVKIWDVSDLGNITLLDTIGSEIEANSIPHNLIFRGDYLYVSYYYDGLYIWDLSDPQNITLAGFYDTSTEPNNQSYKGNWGVYPFLSGDKVLASDMQTGLWVLDAGPAVNPIGIEEPGANASFAVFPNPFSDRLSVVCSEQMPYTVMDVAGRTVASGTLYAGKNTVNLPGNLPSGLYLLRVHGEDWVKSRKLVKH